MSRLGDLLRLERTRRGLSYKQAARLSGVSDKYLMDVESGKRIIADAEARRVLSKMGMQVKTEAEFTLDDIAAAVDLETALPGAVRRAQSAPHPEKKAAEENKDSRPVDSIWLDALKGVLRRVPIYNAVMQEVGHRLLAVENGKIAGAPAGAVFYFRAPDNALSGFRVRRGDIALIVPGRPAEDGALMLVEARGGRMLRAVKMLPRCQVMLQTFDTAPDGEIFDLSDVVFIGRAVRMEAEL